MTEKSFEGERISKRLARAGVASRREAEKLIEAGRVAVDGKVLTSPALNVTEKNKITVDGKVIGEPEKTRLWRLHKESGIITTTSDPQGRATIFDDLPQDMPRVVTVGRLDFTTEGLLLLTNDGELARHLELPNNAWLRHYRVRVYGNPEEEKLAALSKGVTISGIKYEPIKAVLEKQQGSNAWIDVSIREGKNREIRKVMEHLGLEVNRLIRTAFGPFQLGKLEKGTVEEVPQRVLIQQMVKFFGEKK